MHVDTCTHSHPWIRKNYYYLVIESYCRIAAAVFCLKCCLYVQWFDQCILQIQWNTEQCPDGSLFCSFHQQAKMPFDANKLYCSEVLAILLQNNDGETCLWYWYSVRISPRLVSDHDCTLLPLAPLCLCSLSCVCSLLYACTLFFSAAFVLCQAILILLADVSVLDGSKIWQLASFFSLYSPFPPLPSRQQRIARGAGWDRCAASAVICE